MGIEIRTIITVTCGGCDAVEAAEMDDLISSDNWETINFGLLKHESGQQPHSELVTVIGHVYCHPCRERVEAFLGKMLADARARSVADQSTHRAHPVAGDMTLCDHRIESPGLRTMALAMRGTQPTCQECSDILDRATAPHRPLDR